MMDESQSISLRGHKVGDIGWIVHRHGVIYAEEFGWDIRFEGLVAEVLGKFIREYDPTRERCWVAERDSRTSDGSQTSDGSDDRSSAEFMGCVFLVRVDDASSTMRKTCKLRCLLVEPQARGVGLGGRLVDECIAFARSVGYERMLLWTNSVLVSARKIYESRGFRMIEEKEHSMFAGPEGTPPLVGQTWGLDLAQP
jgi:GNAT superfamily N-acetyltransferase